MPPRYLFGPVLPAVPPVLAPPATADWITFGPAGANVSLRPADRWESIAARLPAGWWPQAVIITLGAGYIPVGLWSSPVPVVAIVPDGPRCWHACRQVLPRCDLV